jgi:organic hydroperoxide reductase OsmC/OhrA
MDPHYYDIKVKWIADRKGSLSSSTFPGNLEVATPLPFDQGVAGLWSPEHLLVAAANSCLMTTFLAIAYNSKLSFINFESNGIGKVEEIAGELLLTEIQLFPVLTIPLEKDRESEAACLISNSIRSKISLEPQVTVIP